jgi:hypothetical protein
MEHNETERRYVVHMQHSEMERSNELRMEHNQTERREGVAPAHLVAPIPPGAALWNEVSTNKSIGFICPDCRHRVN